MESVKTINSVKCATFHFMKFLPASAWSSIQFSENLCRKHCLMTSLLVWCASHLQGKQLPSTLRKSPYFHLHISVSEFSISLCCRASGCPTLHLQGIYKCIQFLPTYPYTIQPLQHHDGINMCRSMLYQAFSYARTRTLQHHDGSDQCCIRPSAMLGLGHCNTMMAQISAVLGLQLCQDQDTATS